MNPNRKQIDEMHKKLLALDSKEREHEQHDGVWRLMGSDSDNDDVNDELEHFQIPTGATPKNVRTPSISGIPVNLPVHGGKTPKTPKAVPKCTGFVDGLKTCEFYHGVLPEDEVADLLERDGDFLLALKYSETKKNVVCYVKWHNVIQGFDFTQSADSPEVTMDKISFKPSVLKLVNYHMKANVPIGNAGVRLVRGVQKQSWELDSKNLTAGRLLGEGAFGKVFFGTLKQKGKMLPVAIKIPRMKSETDKEVVKKAMEEARIQREYTHLNIVRLYGVVLDANDFCIVLEYLNGGSLDSFLKSNVQCTITLQLAFCFDIATGMEYLHKHNCLHRDMAARNCLVDRQYPCAKISDFGLSARGTLHQVDRAKPTPIRWMAPEVLTTATFGKPADIWSMAILFWEVYNKCKEVPYADKDLKQVQALLWHNTNYHPNIDPAMPRELKDVLEASWIHDPKKRPGAKQIVDHLIIHAFKARYISAPDVYNTLAFRENLVKYKHKKEARSSKKVSRSSGREIKKKSKEMETKKGSEKRSTKNSNST